MQLGNMEFYYYIAIGGGVLLLLSVVVYFLPFSKIKIPAIVTTGFGAGAVGLTCGIVLMGLFGYQTEQKGKEENAAPNERAQAATKDMADMMKGQKGGANKGGGAPKGGGGGAKGGFGPSSTQQLSSLITALDNVAEKPIHIKLTDEQRKTIMEELKELNAAERVNDEVAKAKLDALLKVLEPQKEELRTVGYIWPGSGGGFGGAGKKEQMSNPFKDGLSAQRLKSLLERLTAKKM
jgi:hypothetical protein